MSEQTLFSLNQPSCRWGVDLRVELMKQSYFFIALKHDTSRKQLKCMPYFILWTALLSFEEGGGGRGPSGVTFFFKFFIYYLFIIFIFGCVGSSFLCEGFLQLRRVGATLHRGTPASHYRGLSCCGAEAPDAQAQ